MALEYAQRFVGTRMIMMIIEYAAAPLGRPAMALKTRFQFGRTIVQALMDEHGPAVVGYDGVIVEKQDPGGHCVNTVEQMRPSLLFQWLCASPPAWSSRMASARSSGHARLAVGSGLGLGRVGVGRGLRVWPPSRATGNTSYIAAKGIAGRDIGDF